MSKAVALCENYDAEWARALTCRSRYAVQSRCLLAFAGIYDGTTRREAAHFTGTDQQIVRSRVEHIFADQKAQTGLFVRTVGISHDTMRIGLANIVYNIRRFLFLERISVPIKKTRL